MKYQLPRWIPENSTEIQHPEGLGIVYSYTKKGTEILVAIAYIGKQSKSAWHYRFNSEQQRSERIEGFFNGLQEHSKMKAKWKAERLEPHSFRINDIVVNSWGYDQTNVDFYQIVETTAHYVHLREIGSKFVDSDGLSSMAGRVVAMKDSFKSDKIIKHYANKGGISFRFGSGSKWDGRPQYNSWYA